MVGRTHTNAPQPPLNNARVELNVELQVSKVTEVAQAGVVKLNHTSLYTAGPGIPVEVVAR
jgi:hypothetical protein